MFRANRDAWKDRVVEKLRVKTGPHLTTKVNPARKLEADTQGQGTLGVLGPGSCHSNVRTLGRCGVGSAHKRSVWHLDCPTLNLPYGTARCSMWLECEKCAVFLMFQFGLCGVPAVLAWTLWCSCCVSLDFTVFLLC
ncbi:hypothetical protein RRG08_047289 [Elysia crispata]|uniref:Uncharacterized protein n=1 Tax=Elysia crispata TaxID=231223 RepID=A0AAE0ZDK1_9GAST|nr:hypothetical protein RRG08_047289 [Elysia crispata]